MMSSLYLNGQIAIVIGLHDAIEGSTTEVYEAMTFCIEKVMPMTDVQSAQLQKRKHGDADAQAPRRAVPSRRSPLYLRRFPQVVLVADGNHVALGPAHRQEEVGLPTNYRQKSVNTLTVLPSMH